MRVLIAGWFSFEKMGVTAGDIIARDIVVDWLTAAGISFDIALARPFEGGVRWNTIDPDHYSHVIFVCGPFGDGWPITEFLDKFSACRLFGLNLTMLQSLDEWNPFDLLLERDSSVKARPDITLLDTSPKVPVVGVILAHKQLEYGKNSLHQRADETIKNFLSTKEAAVVMIDTALENNQGNLKTAREIESLIAKTDVVITTRLHGTVLSIKNGVPVIPIDPIYGGAKISAQVRILDWPILFNADSIDEQKLSDAFDYCLTKEAGAKATVCAISAIRQLQDVRQSLLTELIRLPKTELTHGS